MQNRFENYISSVFEFSLSTPYTSIPDRDRVWTQRGVHCTSTLEIPSISTMAFSEPCSQKPPPLNGRFVIAFPSPPTSWGRVLLRTPTDSLYRAYHGGYCATKVLSSLRRSILMAAPFSKTSPDRRDSRWIDMLCFCSAAHQLIDQSGNIVEKFFCETKIFSRVFLASWRRIRYRNQWIA